MGEKTYWVRARDKREIEEEKQERTQIGRKIKRQQDERGAGEGQKMMITMTMLL